MKEPIHRLTRFAFVIAWLTFVSTAFGQGTFTSKASANWNVSSTWALISGTDADGIPDGDDNVILANKSNVTLTQNQSCASLTINGEAGTAAAQISIADFVLNVSGNILINGGNNARIAFTSGTLNVGGNLAGAARLTPGTGTINYVSNTGGQSIGGYTYNNLTFSHSGGTSTANGNIVVNGTFTSKAGGTINMGANTLAVTGLSHSGILRTQSTAATPISPGKTWGGTIQFDAAAGGQTIVAGTYNNLIVINTSGTNSAGGPVTAVNLENGGSSNVASVLNMAGNTLTTTTIDNTGATLRFSGTTNGKAISTGTVEYYGSTQTVATGTYARLNITAGGAKTAAGNIVAGTVDNGGSLNAAAVLNMAGNSLIATTIDNTGATIRFSGSTNGISINTGTVDYFGTTQTIASGAYNNLSISGTSTKSFKGITTIGNTFTSTGGTMDGGTATLIFTGTSGSITGASAKNFYALQINQGAVLNCTGGNITVAHSYINNGTFKASAVTTNFTTSSQTLSGTGITSFGNIIIRGAIALNAATHNFTVSGVFNISNAGGVFNGGSGTVTFAGTTSVTGTGTFNFTNVTISSGTLTTAVDINVSTALNIHAAIILDNGYVRLKSDASGTARVSPVTGPVMYGSTGRFIVQRYFSARKSWRLMTVPITATGTIYNGWQLGGLTTTTRPAAPAGQGVFVTGPAGDNGLDAAISADYSLKVYNTVTGDFDAVANTKSRVISPGYPGSTASNIGYFNFVGGDRNPGNAGIVNTTMLNDTGKLQIGSFTFPATPAALKLTLVGNPYASPVDFSQVTKNNVANRFYAWDPNVNITGAYVLADDEDNNDGVYTFIPSNEPIPGNTTTTQTKHIQSGQAVFIQTINTANASLVFNESNKSDSNNKYIFRPSVPASAFRTNLYLLDSDNTTSIADGIIAQYTTGYSNAVDVKDGTKFPNANENLALVRDGVLLSLERRQPIAIMDTLFLSLTRASKRKYQFEFMAEGLYQQGVAAYLEDNYLKTSTVIDMSGRSTVNFAITAEVASALANRFRIVFKQVGVLPVSRTGVKAYEQNSNINVEWKVESEVSIKEFVVERSVDGQTFTKLATISGAANTGTKTYQWPDTRPVVGNNYYRISSIDVNGRAVYSKVINVFISKVKPAIKLYPNPIIAGSINLQLINQPKGIYDIRLMDKLGQVIMTKQIKHEQGSSTETMQLGKTMARSTYQLEVIKPGGSRTSISIYY